MYFHLIQEDKDNMPLKNLFAVCRKNKQSRTRSAVSTGQPIRGRDLTDRVQKR